MTTSDVQFAKLESQLADWKLQVVKLETAAEDVAAEAKPAYLREIEALKTQFAASQKQYDDVRKAHESMTTEVMTGLKTTWHDLGVAVGKAMSRFGA